MWCTTYNKLHEREKKNHNYFILPVTHNMLVETYN